MAAAAYFITFTTYGTWLQGRAPGSVDRAHNEFGTPVLPPDVEREQSQRERMRQPEYRLDEARRAVVLRTIREVAEHRGWRVWAAHVRTNHVHVVISAPAKPEKVMSDLKAWCSRRLRERFDESADRDRWTQHGSTRYLWTDAEIQNKVVYVVDEQGTPMACYDSRTESEPEALATAHQSEPEALATGHQSALATGSRASEASATNLGATVANASGSDGTAPSSGASVANASGSVGRTFAVKEIFYTLQGEGAQVGRAAVFCRFAGCNLWSGLEKDRANAICDFCDTDFVGTDGKGGGRFDSAAALADAIDLMWTAHSASGSCESSLQRLVVCTGGEPLLQMNEEFVRALHERGFEVAIETNGTKLPPPGIDWICVSPKANADLVLKQGNELKLIYPQVGAEPQRYEHLDFTHFFLQPMDGPERERNTQLTVRYCLEHPRWRLSLQTQKILGIK